MTRLSPYLNEISALQSLGFSDLVLYLQTCNIASGKRDFTAYYLEGWEEMFLCVSFERKLAFCPS